MVSDDGTKIFIGTDGKLFVKNEKGEKVEIPKDSPILAGVQTNKKAIVAKKK